MYSSSISIEFILKFPGLSIISKPTRLGSVILQDYLEPVDVVRVKAAEDLAIKVAYHNDIINGKPSNVKSSALKVWGS